MFHLHLPVNSICEHLQFMAFDPPSILDGVGFWISSKSMLLNSVFVFPSLQKEDLVKNLICIIAGWRTIPCSFPSSRTEKCNKYREYCPGCMWASSFSGSKVITKLLKIKPKSKLKHFSLRLRVSAWNNLEQGCCMVQRGCSDCAVLIDENAQILNFSWTLIGSSL